MQHCCDKSSQHKRDVKQRQSSNDLCGDYSDYFDGDGQGEADELKEGF